MAAVLFNRYDQVGVDGDQRDSDDALDLNDNFLGPGAFDFDEGTFASLEHPASDPDFLSLGEVDFRWPEEA